MIKTKEYLGSAKLLTTNEVVAGSVITMILEYTVGKYGLDDSGNIMIARRSVSDWEGAKDDPKGFGYTTVSTDGDAILQAKPGVYQRPFHNAFVIKVRDGSLKEGDKITVTFGDTSKGSPGTRVQSFRETEHEIKVLVDPLNTNRFEEVDPIFVNVKPGSYDHMQVVVPSQATVGERFSATVRVLDMWGNPCEEFEDEVELYIENLENSEYEAPQNVKLTNKSGGFVKVDGIKIMKEGTYFLSAVCKTKKLAALSNGLKCGEKNEYKLLWGDAHGQTSFTVGTGSLDEYFSFGKGPAALDFSGWQGNDLEITTAKWEKVKEATKAYNNPGEFVTLLGYEWSGNTPGGGDHNIYYLGDEADFYPHSTWTSALYGQSNDNCRYPISELWEEFRGRKDVMAIPHIGGRAGSLDYFDPEFISVIEIHSHHGTFEWFAREAMERGIKVGFVATSDDHTCRPGLSYPLQDVKQVAAAFDVSNGFTAVFAKEFTREGIWEAIKSRRCYATTFARIGLDVKINDHMMGEEISLEKAPTIHVDVVGTEPIKSVELRRGNETIKKYTKEKENTSLTKLISISWGGVKTRGRRKSAPWNGIISIDKGCFVNAEEVAFDRNEQGIKEFTSKWIEWASTTSGDMDGLELEIDAPDDAILTFSSDQIKYSIAIKDIKKEPTVYDAGGVNLYASISLGNEKAKTYEDKYNESLVKFSYTDKNIKKGLNPYWVKVTQEDGHMAWSSPIFVNYNK